MFRWRDGKSQPDRATYRDVVFERDGDLVAFGDMAIQSALAHNVSPAVHFDDLIFASLYMTVAGKNVDNAAQIYFTNGRISAERVKNIAAIYFVDRYGVLERRLKLLDFASGYGCMSRHVQNVMPNAEVSACDIHQAACDFHREHLKINAERSALEPSLLKASADYDIVVALSFFSHLPKRTFVPWLQKLGEFIKPNGILIFTTNGIDAHRDFNPEVKVGWDGYGSMKDSEQFDIPLDYYLHAITYPEFVLNAIRRTHGFQLVMQFRSIWWTIQDAYVLRRL
jgi:2-polyprenyl-3-methyl-5-hydroxy-6-metoxy-1,4-benzoquinol methylase